MRKPTTRLFALVLCVLLLVSQLGLTDGVAVETEDPAEPVQTSEQFEPAEEPVTDPVEESVEEPVEAPEAEPVEEPEPEITEAPEPEITEAPEPEVTEVPVAEVTEVPEVEATEVPEVEATEVPEVEATEVPEVEATEVPDVEATEVPEVEPTEVPEAEATEEPEPVVSLMSASALEPIVLDEDLPMPAAADVTLSVTPATATAGTAIESITLTVTEGEVTFADEPGASNFTISGAGVSGATVSAATKQEDGSVQLTFSNCTPTTAGDITVTVKLEAFEETGRPEEDVTATIQVSAPTVSVEASTSETLQAGKSGGEITLTATGSVFADTLTTDNFTVTNATVTDVSRGNDTEATLTVTPTAAGKITVNVHKDAFKYQPATNVDASGDLTVEAAEAPNVTASNGSEGSGELQAGVVGGKITLTIDGAGNTFVNSPANTLFSFVDPSTGAADGLKITEVAGSGSSVTLTVTGTPKVKGNLTIKIDPTAFTYQPGDSVTAMGASVKAAEAPTISSATTTLIAGVKNGEIELEATANFAPNPAKELFTLGDGLTVENVDSTGNISTATLTVTGTPTKAGSVDITIQPAAFQYQPDTPVTTSVTVAAPSGSIKAALTGTLYAGTEIKGETVTVTLTIEDSQGLTFKSGVAESDFSLSDTGMSVAGVKRDSESQVTLTLGGTPTEAGQVTITADKDKAFTIAPDADKTATITVTAAPTVSAISAAPDTLTAGVSVTSIKLTATGGTFATNPETSLFALSGVDGLTVSEVKTSDSTATLTVSGAPKTKGDLTITVDKTAFNPVAGNDPKVEITVNAPTGTLEAALVGNPLYAGTEVNGQKITLTIQEGNKGLSFKSGATTGDFSLTGTGTAGLNISGVEGSGNSVTLTLSGKPTAAGKVTVTAKMAAFTIAPDNDITATGDIEVTEVSGTVTAALEGGDLTAGTPVDGQKITLTIGGDAKNLTFKNDGLSADNFQLTGDGADGLTIEKAEKSGDGVTLTLSGTPNAGGDFTVTVQTSAFTVKPTDGADRPAGTITVGYPKITLEATQKGIIYEDEEITTANNTITLKATGGIFNITSDKTYFSVSNIEGVTLESVSVTEESDTATLTISGTPEATGNLTITVKPDAFKFKPENEVTNTQISVQAPTGSITATLDGKLYAGTPLPEGGQTVTIAIEEGSHGMVFKSSQDPTYFTLSDDELHVTGATLEGTTVTLTLSGTPSEAGQVTITATASAFEFSPEGAETAYITVDPAPTVTLDTNPESIVAGIEKEITILLTSENENVKFVNAPQPAWFKLSNSDLSVDQIKVGSDSKSVTLTLSAAPSKDGVLTVTVDPQAFNIRPVSDLTATITIYALYGKVSASFSGTLTAGTDAAGQTITLEITDTNGLTFAANVGADAFTLGPGSEGLEIESVEKTSDTTVTLKLKGIPAAHGEFTVTALAESAFTVKPTNGQDRMSTNKISIGYPTITVTAAPYEDIYEGVDIANNTITVTADGGVFDGDTLDNNITISGHDELTLQSVAKGQGDNIVILNLRGTPTSTDDLTITIQPGAFTYQPEDTLTAAVPVLKPTGKVTATLNGEPLYAGTPVNGQTVTLTIGESTHGLQFKDETELEISEFMLKGDAAAGLTIDAVTWVNDTEVTLTLGGTPTTAGDFEVDAEDSAFTYSPGMEEPAGTFTVNPAPEITVTADPASVTAGLELGAVTVTAEGGTFLAQLDASLFAISSPDGIAEGMEITGVTAVDGTTVTLTVTGAPAKDGTLIVTADREAFVIRPESSPEAKIAVAKLTGSVSMALAGGELTAGTAADGLTLELAAAGEGLTFGADAAPGGFLLTGPGAEGLTVASVTRTDETHVTLTLSGTPAKAGELGVTVTVAAFAVPPTDGQDVTAAPSVTVAYPTVTVTADPASVSQGVDIDTVTLTAVGGVFNAIDGGTDGFGISGVTGVTLVAVSAKDGGDTATLTVTGAPGQTGTLTVTVQPEAFKYQPEKAVTAAITVTGPTGTVAAVLSDALYANTPVAGQTITVTISDSKGLSFKDGLTPDSFQLTGAAATGLTVSGVTGSGASVTLTLSGTPAAGSFTVTALENAFTFDPGQDMDAGTVSVNAAPEVSVTAEPETLTAGEAVGTITITAVGGTFAPTADASLFALSGYGASGLTVSAVTVEGSTATLTITGAPENAGTLTVTVSRAAFSPVAAGDPTVEITVKAGSISTDVETGEGAPAASFGSTVDELADAVLDPEEQALLAQGATVTITLQEQDISASVSAADKAAVEAAAGDYTIGEYLDVTLIKSVNDKPSAVHETSKPIIVVFSVPTALQGANRQFAVVRVHEGTGTLLNDLDSDPNTITIATDLFSTYAIVYRDAPETPPSDAPETPPSDAPETPPSDTPEPTPTEKPAPAAAATSAPTAPDTGDEAAPALWLGLLALCAGALVLTGGLLRRRSGTR